MAQEFEKHMLTGLTNGRSKKIAATSTPGDLIDTAVAGTDDFDEYDLWASNSSASPVKVTVEFGGVTSPDDTIEVTVPGEAGPQALIPHWLLNNALVVRVFAGTTNVITVNGSKNRILGE